MALIYRRHSLTAGRLVDGLAFVVTAEDNKLQMLNTTATHLWTLCGDGVTAEEAARALTEAFDVDDETARNDARECLDDLVRRKILSTHP